LSKSASQIENTPAWKQEVNRRLAAHKRRIGPSAVPETLLEDQPSAGNRGAAVAARVAARYAHAPSYSELLADEARVAVRAAEAASRAALEAQAAAESVLAEIEAAAEAGDAIVRAAHGQRIFEIAEAPVPMHANLIEFPVELDTERRVRARRNERLYAAAVEPERQLSIFEVDPGSILIEQEPVDAVNAAAATALTGSEWLGIELDEEPVPEEIAPQAGSAASALHPASIGLRLMAAVVDGALTIAAVLAFAMVAAVKAQVLPTVRQIEVGTAVALAVFSLLYQALFFTLAEGTPGMKYAHISLCTFDDQFPTRAQKLWRLGALLLSLLPVGLGVGWALFDEEHLGWHDRLSRTYLRKG
jgi:uncharacterized RDD family membrane protein YckC